MQLAIESGADVNKRPKAEIGSVTALMEIAESITGDREASQQKSLRLLIDAKADIDTRDTDGQTGLFHAIIVEGLRFAKILIDAGADLNLQNSDGNSVLDARPEYLYPRARFFVPLCRRATSGPA